MSNITVNRIHPRAQENFAYCSNSDNNNSSVSRHLTLIGRKDNRADDVLHDVNYFNTGLVFTLPQDTYILITANPALFSMGYMMPSPMIIDSSCSDEIMVPLYKFKDGEDLELPYDAVQFTFCKHYQNYLSLESTNPRGVDNRAGPSNYRANGGNVRPVSKNMTYMS